VRILSGTMLTLITTLAVVAGPSPRPELFQLQEVRPGVYAAIAKTVTPLNCNAAVIIGDRDVLVVDSHGTPGSAAALLRHIGKLTPLPVRYVVNTHFHNDHARGNAAYVAPAYPREVTIISTTATRENLETLEPGRLAKDLAALPGQIAGMKDPDERAHAEEALAELKKIRAVLPDLTFDRSLRLHGRGRDVTVLFLGRAHTNGDAVVYLPRDKVVVTGDLVTTWGPGMGDGYPNEWLATLDALAKLDIATVIGGHGKVGGREMITNLRAYIADLIAEVKREVGRRTPRAELEKAVADRLITKHGAHFAPGEFAPRVPSNVSKVYEDVAAGRY
jgi:glyoxylase-like metal-dependent hydrolase (beta-lactamase superfamily II)